MRIVMIGQNGIPARQGGVERHVEELSTRLARFARNEVTVYTRPHFTGSWRRSYKGVRLVPLRSIPTKSLDTITHTLRSVLHALLFVRPDVYHFHGVGPTTLAWMPRVFAPRATVVSTFHSQDRFNRKWGILGRIFLYFGEWATMRFPHRTIAVSRSLQQIARREYATEIEYVPNGVDIRRTRKTDRLKKHGLKRDGYVLVVSRLIPLKRVHEIVEAYKHIKTDMPLVIVGGSSYSDDYVEELQQLAQEDKRVKLLGVQTGEALAQLFRSARLFVTASETEGLPITLLEAAYSGAPLVVSDITEHEEILAEDEGRFFIPGNETQLVKAIRDSLRYDGSETAKARRRKLQRRIATEYDWNKIGEAVECVYEKAATDCRVHEQHAPATQTKVA